MEDTKKRKCLLYWHKKAMGNLPLSDDGRHMILYPGYNSFDYADIQYIYDTAKSHIDRKVLTFYGIAVKDGKFVETIDLKKLSLAELDSILSQTYNPDTLNDLSDPGIIAAVYTKQASERKQKLKEAKGTEADNIDEVKEEKAL